MVAGVEEAAPVDAYSIDETSLVWRSSVLAGMRRLGLPWIAKTSLKPGVTNLKGCGVVAARVLPKQLEHTWPQIDPEMGTGRES